MQNPSYIVADAKLVHMWTLPAFDEIHANLIARKETSHGYITEVARIDVDGVTLWAVKGYSTSGDE